MPSINNFLKGFSNGLPGMKDFRHASRLFIDDNFRLAPKQKFLFHVVFDIDNDIPARPFSSNERFEINMLVKSCELPKYDMNLEEKVQYNKKTYISTRLRYQPINIVFHDDHADVINAFWKAYYEYNIADSISVQNSGGANLFNKDDMYDPNQKITQYGRDNVQQRAKPFLKNIQIFALHKNSFTSFTLVNPVIGSFSHDNLDNTEQTGIMTNTMQIFYETVLYSAGVVDQNAIDGFATIHYDREPSPLSVLGGGTTSIFGRGGIVQGIGSVIGDIQNNRVGLSTILRGINTYNNAKKIKAKDAVKEELKGIVKEGVINIGKQSGTITNPVGNFDVGSVAVASLAAANAIASAKSKSDQPRTTNNVVIDNPVLDTQNFLSPSEAFNLVSNDLTARDKVASAIYYKKIGSRNNLTIAQSDIAYASLNDNQKNVYRSSVLTDINKLVTEGYVKINRQSNNVSIAVEKQGI
jgi:hypothetical protein